MSRWVPSCELLNIGALISLGAARHQPVPVDLLPHLRHIGVLVDVPCYSGAGRAEVVAALREKVPALEGPVIVLGEDRLADEYKFNINVTFYFAGMDFNLKRIDRIALLVPMTGG